MLRFILPAVIALGLTTGARAEEPKAAKVNLDELKYALAIADKRGDNVGAIRDALTAFEKALSKGAIKPGEAPPELKTLRDAVEAAAKKGENVAAISKELGAIEKLLTGSAYVRPAPPEPKYEPEPMFPPRRGGGFGGNRIVIGGGKAGGGGIVINGNGGFNATSITISNGAFTIKARNGEVLYTVSGSTTGTDTKITIKDGDKTTEYTDVKKVPEEHRPAVERLLGMIERG